MKDKILKIKIKGSEKRLFSEVHKSSDLYFGDRIGDAPEIMTYLGDSEYELNNRIYNFSDDLNNLYRDRIRLLGNAGDHTKTGIVIFSGNGFNNIPEKMKICASILDILPTLFALYDIPIPEDYDGKILWDALTKEIVEKKDIQYQKTITREKSIIEKKPKNTEKILSSLKELGYL